MSDKYKNYSLEDFLLDDFFFALAKKRGENSDVWEKLLRENPAQKELMEEACLLINNIRISEQNLPSEAIQTSWDKLERKIQTKKNKKWNFFRKLIIFNKLLMSY